MAKAKTVEAPSLFGEGELAGAPSAPVQSCYDLWNRFAKKNGWQEAKVLDTGRRAALKRACKDYGGVSGFQAMLEKIERSDWCMGRIAPRDGRKQFKADLDWFTRPVTVRKVIEDFYNGGEPPLAVDQKPAPRSQDWRGRLERYLPGKFWHKETEGNRPEDPGPHLAPADMIEKWRKTHGIVEKAAPAVETREQRLSASIASYRRVGQYDRANAIEETLAALEKRPPVLVPAPDVAGLGIPQRPNAPPQRRDNRGHNGPPGPITDVPDDGDPGWSEIPEGDESQAEA